MAPKRILFLDCWSDRNRGDAAMQIGLIGLMREQVPGARITVMAAYGSNQWPEFATELDETSVLVDDVVGGIKPTFVPFGGGALDNRNIRRALNGLGSLLFFILWPIWPLIAKFSVLDRVFPRSMRSSLTAIREADLVIWNGRNFRSDSAKRETYEVWSLLYNPIVCAAFGKPMACIGASIWPLQRRSSEWVLSRVLGRTFFTSLREPASYEYATRLVDSPDTELALLPDLSIAVLASGDDVASTWRDLPAEPRRIAITVVDWPNMGLDVRDAYVAALEGVVKTLLADERVEITLVPQVTYEMEGTAFVESALLEVGGGRVTQMRGRPSVDELASLYSDFDLLIATRMHSAIFATSRGVPVVTIPYDAGGKWGILSMMGVQAAEVPYGEATTAKILARIDEVWSRREALRADIAAALPPLADEVRANLGRPLELFAAHAPKR
jgi:colanic acid/amylovoran biosynthesis protein